MNAELERCFCELYRQRYHPLWRRARYLVGQDHVARELVDEVFFKVVVELEEGNRKVLEPRYLTRMLTNRCLDHLRSHPAGRELWLSDELAETLIPVGGEEQTARVVHVGRLLAGLPEELLALAIYRYLDGLTLDELGALVELPRRTLQRRLELLERLLQDA